MNVNCNQAVSRLAALAMVWALVAPAVAQADAVLPPDRADRIGAAPITAPVQLAPDRVDGLGSRRLPYVPVPTVIVRTTGTSGFSWADAAVGAASAAAVSLLAAAAIVARRRRHVTVPS